MKILKKLLVIILVLTGSNKLFSMNQIHNLCQQNNLSLIRRLILENTETINTLDEYGQSAIFLAIENNQEKLIDILLKQKSINLNQRDKFSWTPLHWAVKLDQYDTVKKLLEHKADPNAQDFKGRTPLHLAIKNNNNNIAKLLLCAKDIDLTLKRSKQLNTYLHYTIKEKNYDLTNYLIILDVNSLLIENIEKKNPINLILDLNDNFLFELLIDCWPLLDPKLKSHALLNPELRQEYYQYLLHYAWNNSLNDLFDKLLAQYNIDVNYKYNHQRICLCSNANISLTILDLAITSKDFDSVKKIVESNKKIVYTSKDINFINWAVLSEDQKILKYLCHKFPSYLVLKGSMEKTPIEFMLDKVSPKEFLEIINLKSIKSNSTLLVKVLYNIAKHNKGQKVLSLISSNYLNTQNCIGNNVLHLSIFKEDLQAVNNLIKSKIDINAKNKLGYNALYLAVEVQNKKILKTILNCKSLKLENSDLNIAPLELALQNGNESIVSILLNKKELLDKINTINIYFASNNYKILKLLQNYLTKNKKNISLKDKEFQVTALHIATSKDQFNQVKNLIKCGHEVNIQNVDKQTPLHIACQKNDLNTVNYLLEKKADPNIQDKNGRTALHTACRFNYVNIIKTLLKSNADINARDKEIHTPLHYACAYNQYEAVKELCSHTELDVNAYYKDKNISLPRVNAFHTTIMTQDNHKILELLFNHCSSKSCKNIGQLKNELINLAFIIGASNSAQYIINSLK